MKKSNNHDGGTSNPENTENKTLEGNSYPVEEKEEKIDFQDTEEKTESQDEGKNIEVSLSEETETLKRLEKPEKWTPSILRLHFRFIPFLHWDHIKSRRWLGFIGPFHPYGILNNIYKFIADVFEYRNKKRKYIGTITEPGIREKRYRNIYYRAMFIYKSSGELDPSNEMCEDTPQEFRINSDAKKPPKICFYVNLQSITPPDLFTDHQIQQREKEFHETIWAAPMNIIKLLPSLIFSKKRTKIMELGELYDINNEFVKGDGNLTLNENVIREMLTLGAISFDLEIVKNGKTHKIASINRSAWRRIFTFGIWRDYYIKIYNPNYDRLDFKVFLSLVTSMLHNRKNIRKHVRENMHLRVPVRNIMRYST